MFRRTSREVLPWYRKPSYRGKLTEAQKRHLDSIREREPHPATRFEQLPDEVQSYITELEMAVYDSKQQSLAGRTLLVSGLGAILIDANFLHLIDWTNWWAAIIAGPLLLFPWIFYAWQWRRNADEFSPPANGADWTSPSDEKLREAWELDHIVRAASHRD
jgi:hypothetical protein